MTSFQPWGWHYRVRAPKWLAAVSLLLLSLHATTSLGLVGLETADFLERADPDRFLSVIGFRLQFVLELRTDDEPRTWVRVRSCGLLHVARHQEAGEDKAALSLGKEISPFYRH